MSALAEPQTELMRQHNRREAARANIRARGEAYRGRISQESLDPMPDNCARVDIVQFIRKMKERTKLCRSTKLQKKAVKFYNIRPIYSPDVALKVDRRKRMTKLASITAQKHGLCLEAIKSPLRTKEVNLARQEFCYEAVQVGLWNCEQIGDFLRRDRTTVAYAVNRYCFANKYPHPLTGEILTKNPASVISHVKEAV